MDTHLQILAVLHIGLGILGFIVGGFVFFLLTGIGVVSQEQDAMLTLGIIGTVAGIILFVLSVPSVIGGWGLWRRKSWSRVVLLIVGAIDLFNFPIGTALGVYTIWALVQAEAADLLTA